MAPSPWEPSTALTRTKRGVLHLVLPDGRRLRIAPQPDGRLNLHLPGRWHLGGFYAAGNQTNIGVAPD